MRKIEWTNEMIDGFKVMGDKELAQKYDLHRLTVLRERQRRKIKPYNNQHNIKEHKFINGIENKWCNRGKHWEPIINFCVTKKNLDGLRYSCKTHDKDIRKQLSEWTKKYQTQWTKENLDKIKAKEKRYNDSEKGRTNWFKKRERRKNAYITWNKSLEEQMYEVFGKFCAWCGAINDIEREHFIPIKLGGKTKPGNIYPTCINCNRGKGGKFGKHPEQWCIERWGDNQKYLEIEAKLLTLENT